MTENEVAKIVVDAAFKIHTQLGPGLLETVYEVVLAHELRKQGLSVARQVLIPIVFDGLRFEEGFRADLIVDELLIVELKSVDCFTAGHGKQLLTYLRLINLHLGLLINFGAASLKDGGPRGAYRLAQEPPTL